MGRIKLRLTAEERKELKKQFHKTKSIHMRERIHAILLKDKKYKVEEIANILDCGVATIKLWTKLYRKGGLGNLEPKPQPGNNKKLTKEQKSILKEDLDKSTPVDFGYKKRFWTILLLKTHIAKKFSVVYQSERSYHTLFAYCGFTFHKPAKKDYRQDAAKIEEFEKEIKKKFEKPTEIQSYWLKTKHG